MSIKTMHVTGTAGGVYDFNGTPAYDYPTYQWDVQRGTMVTFGHKNHPHAGGPWFQTKTEDLRSSVDVDISGFRRRYRGNVVLGQPVYGTTLPDLPQERSDQELDAFGTSAIAATEPTASEWSLAQALTELKRDGLPPIPGHNTMEEVKDRRGLSSDYLATDFGWLPLMRDFASFLKAVERSDEIIRQYKRDSGRKIRRRASGPSRQDYGTSYTGRFHLFPNPGSTVGWARGVQTWTISDRMWFSGAFTYYLPDSKAMTSIHEFALKARRLHGVEITPEVIWNVAPWSWAADWFGNFGDVMHNVSALGRDGLVMRYGYVMHERIREVTSKASIEKTGDGLTRVVTETRRIRRPATPYGFGLSFDGFSPKQLATIAALGMSIPK